MMLVDEQILETACHDLNTLFGAALKGVELKIRVNWTVTEKAISEVGGRLIEDFILMSLPAEVSKQAPGLKGKFLSSTIPESHRAMEDIAFSWQSPDGEHTLELLVDVKGHNEKKSGSRPNLASIRKCIDLYSDSAAKELFIFFCRYTPTVACDTESTDIAIKIDDASFGPKGMFLLRRLSDSNMDPANIGSGGQILLAREHCIELVDRTRNEMVIYLKGLQQRLASKREEKKAKLETAPASQ